MYNNRYHKRYTSYGSLSQPDSPRLGLNISMDNYYGNLSQPNMMMYSPLSSPISSPVPSPVQSKLALPTTTTTVVMTKTTENNNHLSPVMDSREPLLTSEIEAPGSNKKFDDYYATPSETPTVMSPVLKNNKNLNQPIVHDIMSSDMVINEEDEDEEDDDSIDAILNRTIKSIAGNHDRNAFMKKSEYIQSTSDRMLSQYKSFQLQSGGRKSKVYLEGKLYRWTEEDPFSIYSNDVTRFSTSPTSKIQSYEQRRDVSVETIISENNGYWQECNFLITVYELIIFPGRWDNKVIEVMTISDDINITISSILFTKSEWVIEVVSSEKNVYSQSNPIANKFNSKKEKGVNNKSSTTTTTTTTTTKEAKNNENTTNNVNNLKTDTKANTNDNKKDETNASGSSSTELDSSRQCRWIFKFEESELMFYFISLLKYSQTKILKNLCVFQYPSSNESDSNNGDDDQDLLEDVKIGGSVDNQKNDLIKNDANHHVRAISSSSNSEFYTPRVLNTSFDSSFASSSVGYSNTNFSVLNEGGSQIMNQMTTPMSPVLRRERKSSLANNEKRGRPKKVGNVISVNSSFANVNIESGKERRSRKNSGPNGNSITGSFINGRGASTSRERKSSLAYVQRGNSTSRERKNSTSFIPRGNSIERKSSYSTRIVLPSGHLFNKEEDNKNLVGRSGSINSTKEEADHHLSHSIRKAELEIKKLKDWHKTRNRSNSNSNTDSSLIANSSGIMSPGLNTTFEVDETNPNIKGGNNGNPLSSPRLGWQNSERERDRKSKMNKFNSLRPDSSAAIFTNIQLSYLDILENKTKNKIINFGSNRNTSTTDKELLTEVAKTENNTGVVGTTESSYPTTNTNTTTSISTSTINPNANSNPNPNANSNPNPNLNSNTSMNKSIGTNIPIVPVRSRSLMSEENLNSNLNRLKAMDESMKRSSLIVPSTMRHSRSSSLTKIEWNGKEEKKLTISPSSKSHPIAIPVQMQVPGASPTGKYSSISPADTGISDSSSTNRVLRKGSVTGGMSNNSSFYSPRSSSLYIDGVNINTKGISGIDPNAKTNSIITNITSTSLGSDTAVVDHQKSPINEHGIIPVGITLPVTYGDNDNSGGIQRNSIHSNISHNSHASIASHTSRNSMDNNDNNIKMTPDLNQMTAMLRKSSLENEHCIPHLNDGISHYDIPTVTVNQINKNAVAYATTGNSNTDNSKVRPLHSANYYHNHNILSNNGNGSMSPVATSSNISSSVTNTTSGIIGGVVRSSSVSALPNVNGNTNANVSVITPLTPLTHSSSVKTNENNNINININRHSRNSSVGSCSDIYLMKLANQQLKQSKDHDVTGHTNKNSNGSEAIMSSPGTETNYLPYMMDLKASNELYLASLQRHIQQAENPLSQNSVFSSGISSPSLTKAKLPVATTKVQPPIPPPHGKPFYNANDKSNGNDNNNNNNNGSGESNDENVFSYYDAFGQLVKIELNDENIIPLSYMKPYTKHTSKPDPVILNSLEILDILEQTYI